MEHPAAISIVDDDVSVRGAVRRLLKVHGHEAYTFESAEAFLHSDQLRATSCLVADVRMPGMSGLELLEYLAENEPRISVILITAFPEERGKARAMKSGAICLLKKPFDEQTFIGYVNVALKKALADPSRKKPD